MIVHRSPERQELLGRAVGGDFDLIGGVEERLTSPYRRPGGLVVDVGCGPGRLTKALAAAYDGDYLGTDVNLEFLAHARTVGLPHWRFEPASGLTIPERDGSADLVCFFSVATHLLHEQSY